MPEDESTIVADQAAHRNFTIKAKQRTGNLFYLSIVCLIIAAFFFKTIFQAKPVSKDFAISSMDSLYHPQVKTVQVTSPVDPCIYFFQIPTSIAVERIFKQGQIPLWSSENAGGHPIMANIESCVFAWHHLLFPSSSEYWYNISIVVRIMVSAAGAFYLARSFDIKPLLAAWSGILYALCPNLMRGAELSTETWSYPWLLLLFMHLSKKLSSGRMLALAGGCALVCATIHPECSFNTILIGSALFVCRRANATNGFKARLTDVLKSFTWLTATGIVTFCLAAPLLLPFIEFMLNSDSHKFQNVAPPVVPLPAFFLTLAHPTMAGSSPFLGVFCLPLVAVALVCARRQFRPLLIVTAVTVAIASLIGPLSTLFSYRPWNLLEPHYLQPVCMLFFAFLMAEGVEQLRKADKKVWITFVSAVILTLAAPAVLRLAHAPIESLSWDFEKIAIHGNIWKKDLCLLLAGCLIFLVANFKKTGINQAVVLLLAANLVSQLTISRTALPTHASFNYPAVGPVPFLKKHSGRSIAMGRHFIVPDINKAWGLEDFRNHNSLYVARYLEFQALCGARRYFATDYRYEDGLSDLLDAASVKYISSRSPVYNKSDLNQLRQSSIAVTGFKNLKVHASEPVYSPSLKQTLCLLHWQTNAELLKSSKIQFATLNQSNQEVWSSNEFPLSDVEKHGAFDQVGRWLIPQAEENNRLKLVLRCNNLWSDEPIWPTGKNTVRNNAVIKEFVPAESVTEPGSEGRLKLVDQALDGTRTYENTRALPAAYTLPIDAVRWVSDKAHAAKSVSNNGFNPRAMVILENNDDKRSDTTESALAPSTLTLFSAAQMKRLNANQVKLSFECKKPSYLILTDTFYPGWKAYLNSGKESLHIFRANYLFRAVAVPAGKNVVIFSYEPDSFKYGLAIFAATLMLVFPAQWRRAKRQARSE